MAILTDPGNHHEMQKIPKVDVILVTHEHPDHIHLPILKAILGDHPQARVVTHAGVGKLLDEEKISYERIVDGGEVNIQGVSVVSCGVEHARIHLDVPIIQNTGFLIAKKLFYPGDSFYDPKIPVQILALPVSAPWLKLEESVEYAKRINPKVVFPVHDGMLRQDHRMGPTRRIPKAILEPLGIRFVDMIEGSVEEF